MKKLIIILGILGISFLFISNYYVNKSTQSRIFTSVTDIQKNKVGLLLGTGKYLENGNINLYYKYRIDAALQLFLAGKIDFILISGDNSKKEYDEPSMMKNDLIEKGVPVEKIYLDYAGFRTLDSVVRSKFIFGQNKITFISQKFHNQRAVFIANYFGIEAVAFNAKDVNSKYGFKTRLREVFARAKAVVDIVFNIEPKFYGDKIIIK